MKRNQVFAVVICLGIITVQSAWAHSPHRPRTHVGVVIGPVWSPFWFPPPVYYPPPVLIAPPAPLPPVYIEQVAPPPAATTADYWYYCKSARAYYPAVADCAEGWLPVLPQPEK
ncbi:hypothetical protein [Azonexus sp.]|uniref:hypothetical protein n=1 Tax=Azonexus sp. TaxID=1872668 RepID=UPI0027B92C9B|nr:hypothetical protein [Azonexus sp.]